MGVLDVLKCQSNFKTDIRMDWNQAISHGQVTAGGIQINTACSQ